MLSDDFFDASTDPLFDQTTPDPRHPIPLFSFTQRYNPFHNPSTGAPPSSQTSTSGAAAAASTSVGPFPIPGSSTTSHSAAPQRDLPYARPIEGTYNRGRHILPPNFTQQSHPRPDTSTYVASQTPHFVSCPPASRLLSNLPYRITIDNEDVMHCFTEDGLVDILTIAKNEFDLLDLDIFREARNRMNPYEKIKNSIFQNRAAVKMANIDKATNISSIPNVEGETQGMLYFCDICSGPGGFTEYLYWKFNREQRPIKGWGFTLKDENDFRIDKFHPGAICDNFEQCYGVDGSGNIYLNENIQELGRVIDKGTAGRGVGLVMADGGFPIQQDYNKQEVLTKQIILCQLLTGIYVLRQGGNYMCKVFDVFCQFSADLFFLLYQHFERVAILKPRTSRVANSERYVVGINLLSRRPEVCKFLFRVNEQFNRKQNVVSLLRQEEIQRDKTFVDFFSDSVNTLGHRQLHALGLIKKAVEDRNVSFANIQMRLAAECLQEWGLPERDPMSEARRRGRGRGGRGGRRGVGPYRRGYVRGRGRPTRRPTGSGFYPDERGSDQGRNVWEDGTDADDYVQASYYHGPTHSDSADRLPQPARAPKRPRPGNDGALDGQPPNKVTRKRDMADVHDNPFQK